MFKKFVPKEDISGQNLTKTSVQRGIRSKIIEQYPAIEPYSDVVLPKKSNIIVVKCRDHINLISVENEIIFFQHYEGPYYPTLKILHQYPFILPQVQVDRGAIKFVLSGANIMCPGLTSPGGKLPDGIAKDTIVAIMAEGKQHALAIGKTLMTSEEMKSTNKGHGIENIHSLGDGLWKYIPEKPE